MHPLRPHCRVGFGEKKGKKESRGGKELFLRKKQEIQERGDRQERVGDGFLEGRKRDFLKKERRLSLSGRKTKEEEEEEEEMQQPVV
jgi:hypothetical protein